MLRSQTQRTIEVLVSVYEALKRCAEQEGTTISALLDGLITDGEACRNRSARSLWNSPGRVGRFAFSGSG